MNDTRFYAFDAKEAGEFSGFFYARLRDWLLFSEQEIDGSLQLDIIGFLFQTPLTERYIYIRCYTDTFETGAIV